MELKLKNQGCTYENMIEGKLYTFNYPIPNLWLGTATEGTDHYIKCSIRNSTEKTYCLVNLTTNVVLLEPANNKDHLFFLVKEEYVIKND